MWVWHRKMTAENGGLSVIKKATKVLTAVDLPANWRDHIEVVTRNGARCGSTRSPTTSWTPSRPWPQAKRSSPWTTAQGHYRGPPALQLHDALDRRPPPAADPHLRLERLMEAPRTELKLVGVFDTNSQGRNPGNPNCFLFPLPNGAWRVYPLLARRCGGRDLEPGRCRLDDLLLQPPAGPGDRRQGPRRHRRPGQEGIRLSKPRRRHEGRQGPGPARHDHRPDVRGPQDHAQAPQGRPPDCGDRTYQRGRREARAQRLAGQEDQMGASFRDCHPQPCGR